MTHLGATHYNLPVAAATRMVGRAASVLAVMLLTSAAPAGAWIATLGHGGSDAATAVVVDGADDVIAVGSAETDAGPVFTVAKFRGADGQLVWRRFVTGSGDGTGQAYAVAVDRANDVIAVGFVNNQGTNDDFAIVKWDAAGNERWRRFVDGDSNYYDRASAVAVDGSDNVIAGGFIVNQATWYDYFVVELNAGGTEQWRAAVSGANGSESLDEAKAVAVDRDGNVVAAGTTDNGDDLVVVAWSPTGQEQWRRSVRGTDTILVQDAAAIRTDSTGAVIVAGALNNAGTGFDMIVIKWDRMGTEQWRRSITGSAPDSGDFASALAVDAADDVVVAGYTSNDSSQDWTLAKWSPAGTELWRKVLIGDPQFSGGAPAALATDAAGAVIAAGSLGNATTYFSDAVVYKWASDGPLLWRRIIDGSLDDENVTSEASDGFAGVAVDRSGNVIAAGTLLNVGTLDDFTVVKLNGATGGDAICGNAIVEVGEQCDPGPDAAGDCCSAACQFELDGTVCGVPPDECAAADTCGAGQCHPGNRQCRLDVPDDPVPVSRANPIVLLDCEAPPGSVCTATIVQMTTEAALAVTDAARHGGSGAAKPRRLSGKARVKVGRDGQKTLKLKLNGRGNRLLTQANGAPFGATVQATIRTPHAPARALQKLIQLIRAK